MRLLLLFLFLVVVSSLRAQTILQNNPPRIKWYRIEAPNFNVLYPEGFDEQAQRMVNTLEHIRKAEAQSLGPAPRKISILLQNQSSVSNGFVSVFPRRSEFYAMPSQNYSFTGTNDWLDLLASHEYRHIVQYEHATRGFNRLFFYLIGYPSLAALAHVSAPDWFWEGDAVVTETAFTPGGRGRIPYFNLVFRTNLLEGRTFNYHKQYLRSYKHEIPNHYVLGYNMVSYLRKRTDDPLIWGKITKRSWSVPFIPFAFSNAIRKETGLTVTKLYREMARDLKREWQQQVDTLQLTAFTRINPRRNSAYTDYLYPQPQADGSVLAMKEGIGDIPVFVKLKDGKEKHVFTPGFLNNTGMLSAVNGLIVWNEFGYDPRWQVRNYSLVKAFNVDENERTVISDKQVRYAGAAISPDGQYIVTIETNTLYQHRVVVLNTSNGDVHKVFDNPENDFFSMPRWSNDGKSIVALRTNRKGRWITALDVAQGSINNIAFFGNENVGHPVLYENFLFFSTPVSSIDNIHVLDMKTNIRYQVTESKYGSYNPAVSPDGKVIYYNEMQRNGMDVVSIPFDVNAWKLYDAKREVKTFYQRLIEQEGNPSLFDSIPQQQYTSSRYRKAANLINPYSWGIFMENNLANVDVGITSQDILSTTSISAGYRYDLNERNGLWRANVSYQGLFPIIDIEASKGKRSYNEGDLLTTIINGQDTTNVVNRVVFQWHETNLRAGLRIPLITTQSRFASSVSVSNAVGYTRTTDFTNGLTNTTGRFYPRLIRNDTVFLPGYAFMDYTGNGNLIYNHAEFSATRLLKQSRRDIRSKWGQALFVDYLATPFGGDFEGGLFSAVGYLFFPGLAKHHSLNGYVAYQQTQMGRTFNEYRNDYLFRNNVPVPRGLSVSRFERFVSMSANYTLPLWYPDIAIGPILNIQRLRLNLFTDYAMGNYRIFGGQDRSYHSVGGELTVDFNVFRFLPQFNMGVRYSYGISSPVTNVEVIIGTFNF